MDTIMDAVEDTEQCIEQGVAVGDDNAAILAKEIRRLYEVNAVKDWREKGITKDTELCNGIDCQDCKTARLIDRQRLLIEALTSQVVALKEEIAAHVRGEA